MATTNPRNKSTRGGKPLTFSVVLAVAQMLACRSSTDIPATRVVTTVLPAPEDSASVFEPNIAVDTENPDRIVAGAQYHEGYNRGGLRFWTWASDDGGATWDSKEVMPRALSRPPTMAADLSLAFGPEGELLLVGISGDSVRIGVPDAALAIAVSDDGGKTFMPRALVGGSVDISPTQFHVSDKPWAAVDRMQQSPHLGNLYLAWTKVMVRLDTDPLSLTRELVLSTSHDGGRTSSSPVIVAPEGHGAQLVVRPDGTLDVVWLGADEATGSEALNRMFHALSSDGGSTFSQPQLIEALTDTTETLDLPTLAVNSEGNLLACWVRGPASESLGTATYCSHFEESHGWTRATAVITPTAEVAFGYPAVASSANMWWLINYRADSIATRVMLLSSRDGLSFAVSDTLATVALPIDRFCPRPMLPCRRDLTVFSPGDYVALAGSADRLAAVYVLPADGDAESIALGRVSIIDLSPKDWRP